jgi:hypothetical protein
MQIEKVGEYGEGKGNDIVEGINKGMEERIERLEHENKMLKLRSTEEGDSSTRVIELEDELQE